MDRSAREPDEDGDRPMDEGLARFEVEGLDADRTLLRALARRLAEPGDGAAALRKTVASAVEGTEKAVESAPPKRGGVLAALRRSPLVGADLDLRKTRHPGRDVDLCPVTFSIRTSSAIPSGRRRQCPCSTGLRLR